MEEREALTVRVPVGLLSKAREVKSGRESLNELVVTALDREVRRRQGLAVYAQILELREQLKSSTGWQPDSVPLIRALREGLGRRD